MEVELNVQSTIFLIVDDRENPTVMPPLDNLSGLYALGGGPST